MKKGLLITALITIVVTYSAFSQRISAGLKGGISANKLSGKSFKEQFSFGFHGGGFISIGVNDKFAIQPELLFSQSTFDTSTNFSVNYNFDKLKKVRLNYMSIPILLNFKPIKMLTIQAGPQFSILLNKSSSLVQNGKDAFKGGDFSMVAGGQINFTNLIFYGRYVVGLSNVNDIDNKEKWKNESVQVGVGISF